MYASLEREAEKPMARNVAAISYAWEFYSALHDYSAHSYAKVDAQVFGKDIACLLALMDEKFVRKEQIAAGDPALQAAIRKQLVYNSVKNIAKYYRQKQRNGGFTPADAELLAHVVKVASMPGSPEHIANVSLYFERKGVNVRLSCNFAGDFIDEFGSTPFEDRYYDEVNYLDLNAGYTFGGHYTVFAEANNLLNQPLRYYQGKKDLTAQAEYYGPKLNVGFKVNF